MYTLNDKIFKKLSPNIQILKAKFLSQRIKKCIGDQYNLQSNVPSLPVQMSLPHPLHSHWMTKMTNEIGPF